MKSRSERKKIVKELLNITDREFTDEELIHQLTETSITSKSNKSEKLRSVSVLRTRLQNLREAGHSYSAL